MREDRRRHGRVRVSLPAFIFEGPTGKATATVTDVSSCGLCVNASLCDCTEQAKDFQEFETAFFAPGVPWPIVLHCKTVWYSDNGETVEFGSIISGGDAGSKIALQQYLARCCKERAAEG